MDITFICNILYDIHTIYLLGYDDAASFVTPYKCRNKICVLLSTRIEEKNPKEFSLRSALGMVRAVAFGNIEKKNRNIAIRKSLGVQIQTFLLQTTNYTYSHCIYRIARKKKMRRKN